MKNLINIPLEEILKSLFEFSVLHDDCIQYERYLVDKALKYIDKDKINKFVEEYFKSHKEYSANLDLNINKGKKDFIELFENYLGQNEKIKN